MKDREVKATAQNPPKPQSQMLSACSAYSALWLLAALLVMTACGKKGPPLPPLVRLPQAPSELTATRRGDTVDLELNVPSVNTDGSRPANVTRVDVYAFSGPDVKDEELFKADPKVGSVAVKAPKDPNEVVEEDEPDADMEPAEGAGLEQGAKASLEETLTDASLAPLVVASKKKRTPKKPAAVADVSMPLTGPPLQIPARTYVAVAVNKHGQKGSMTPRRLVPLVPAPPPVSAPAVKYDETTITVSWQPPAGVSRMREPASESDHILPSKLNGYVEPSIGYNVYELPSPSPAAEIGAAAAPATTTVAKPAEKRLTGSPITDPTYADKRMTWGAERCYAVRTVVRYGELSIESGDAPSVCVKLVDTFPPAPPKGLQSVATAGAISLIWQPNGEKDLAGYIVLRGTTAGALAPITPAAISDTAFKDEVPAGSHFFYAVKAVDKAGNISGPSNTEEATAR